jgi:DNA-binding transcriptional LysR family regulator
MIDWDDVRYFLAVARGGSVRAAAERLKVNHSTVLRRVAQLEERLGTHMFEKLPSGYRLTDAGEEVLESRSRWKRRRTNWRRASSAATRAYAGFCG